MKYTADHPFLLRPEFEIKRNSTTGSWLGSDSFYFELNTQGRGPPFLLPSKLWHAKDHSSGAARSMQRALLPGKYVCLPTLPMSTAYRAVWFRTGVRTVVTMFPPTAHCYLYMFSLSIESFRLKARCSSAILGVLFGLFALNRVAGQRRSRHSFSVRGSDVTSYVS